MAFFKKVAGPVGGQLQNVAQGFGTPVHGGAQKWQSMVRSAAAQPSTQRPMGMMSAAMGLRRAMPQKFQRDTAMGLRQGGMMGGRPMVRPMMPMQGNSGAQFQPQQFQPSAMPLNQAAPEAGPQRIGRMMVRRRMF